MNTSRLLNWTAISSPLARRYALRPKAPWLLTAAATMVVGAVLLPVAYLVLRAAGVGPEAWQRLVQPRVLVIFLNSAALTVAVSGTSVLLAMPMAWLTTVTDLPGQRFWRVATVLPLVIPSYVGGFAILAMFGPKGVLQGWLEPLGIQRLPEIYGFPGAWLTLTLFTYPYVLLTVRAVWRRLDGTLVEAARGLGHEPWSVFWRVVLPHLRPGIAAGMLLVALYTLSDFGAVSLLRFNVFTQAIYVQYRSSFDRSQAALLALFLVLTTLIILGAEQRTRGRARYARSTGTSGRPLQKTRLGHWKWPALGFLGGIVLLALGLPLAMILTWLVRGALSGESWQPIGQAILHSLYAAGLAALVTTVMALPVALLATRFPGRLARMLEQGGYLGYGLPGVVIALSLVFFFANYLPVLYQTLAILIFAYAVRFLPQAMGATRASLLQVSPRLEEAGRGLGLSSLGVWWTITLPLVRPGLLAGAALVFLTAIKELPATLLLSPTGFSTLATEIWSATAEAFFARAAAPALILVLVSSVSITIILAQDRDHG